MYGRLRILAGALALACASPATAETGPDGCETPTLDAARQRASAIFRGVVARVDRDEAGCKAFLEQIRGTVFDDDLALTRACGPRAAVRVSSVWKGDVPADVTIIESADSRCGVRLEAGRTYLVFASRVPGAAGWFVFGDSGTRPLGGADDETALWALSPPR